MPSRYKYAKPEPPASGKRFDREDLPRRSGSAGSGAEGLRCTSACGAWAPAESTPAEHVFVERLPLGVQAERWYVSARALIPVARVRQITLLAMQVGVDARA